MTFSSRALLWLATVSTLTVGVAAKAQSPSQQNGCPYPQNGAPTQPLDPSNPNNCFPADPFVATPVTAPALPHDQRSAILSVILVAGKTKIVKVATVNACFAAAGAARTEANTSSHASCKEEATGRLRATVQCPQTGTCILTPVAFR